MNALGIAKQMGLSPAQADLYLQNCTDVVESDLYVAVLKGNTVHLAAQMKGLSGRKLLRECRATLARWFEDYDVLFAPVKPYNSKAVNLAKRLGFHEYTNTSEHIWLLQTKEHFHGH